jgi:stress-induced morphogen
MIASVEIERRIKTAVPDAEVAVRDLTGTSDHYHVQVVSAGFAGMSSVDRHRLVHAPLRDVLGGALHAIELVTKTPAEHAAEQGR